MKYLMMMDCLPDGNYITCAYPKWHEKLRIKLAKWLFASVQKKDKYDIKTTSGVAPSRDKE